MLSRFVDLVVLVAELTQRNNKSFKELDAELADLGYSEDEIEQAFSWITSRWEPVGGGGKRQHGGPVFRVLSPWEQHALDSEAYAYLLQLNNLGVLGDDQLEDVLKRISPYGAEPVGLSDVKSLVGSVLLNLEPEAWDIGSLDVIDEEIQAT